MGCNGCWGGSGGGSLLRGAVGEVVITITGGVNCGDIFAGLLPDVPAVGSVLYGVAATVQSRVLIFKAAASS